LAQRRAERLRSILDEPWAGRFQEIGPGDQKASHILNAPVARSGLAGPGTITLATMMEDASRPGGPDPSVERARARAHAVLLARSIAAIRPLTRDRCPAPVLDAIETDLRWASRLQAELVRSQQALMYKTIQGHLGSQVTSLTRSRALSVLQASITAVSAAVDHFDPEKGGRLAAPAGLALNRVVSQWARADGHTGRGPDAQTAGPRAVRSLKPTDVALHDWALNLNSWQAWLEPDPRVRPALPSLDESARNLLERRYGWAGGPPESVQQIAASMHTSPARASRLLHEALRSALVAARRGPHAAQAPERGSG
jgi:hypothetical protein